MALRVIAGKYRRRLLQSLPGDATRPMLDSLRETLFNVLQNRVAGKVFVDLYAGTGAVGIEALSRGAAKAVFVEEHPRAVAVIYENLRTVGAESGAQVIQSPVGKALPRVEGDLFFLGPPYALTEEYENTLRALGETLPELVVAQHAKTHALADDYGALRRFRLLRQGSNSLSFYEPA
jgi:16S rRNA (guanine(966)-N(2))-methyltransferase RsmD